MRLNPFLCATDTPPIPQAKAWAAAYDGRSGPLLDLSQAVPGDPPPPEMLRRLGEAAANPDAARYGEIAGDRVLRETYAHEVATLYGATVSPDEVAITMGCNEAFFVTMLALAGRGDRVMLPTPWYFNHKMTLDMLGIEAVPLPCRPENGLVPSPEEAEALLDDTVRAICLVTPNNPCGAVYPPETIAAFAGLCARRDIALVVDETYRDFRPPEAGAPHPVLARADLRPTLIQLYSFSKAYAIAGHRMGAIVAPPAAMAEITKALDALQICPARAPQLVLPWAIEALRETRRANAAEIADRAAAFAAALEAAPGWRLAALGAFFAYVEIPDSLGPGLEAGERLARQGGVLCLPGAFFGPGQERFLRLAFANVGREEIADLPARLAAVMA